MLNNNTSYLKISPDWCHYQKAIQEKGWTGYLLAVKGTTWDSYKVEYCASQQLLSIRCNKYESLGFSTYWESVN